MKMNTAFNEPLAAWIGPYHVRWIGAYAPNSNTAITADESERHAVRNASKGFLEQLDAKVRGWGEDPLRDVKNPQPQCAGGISNG
jgi:hypothetical protein